MPESAEEQQELPAQAAGAVDRRQLAELAVVLAVGVLPPLVSALAAAAPTHLAAAAYSVQLLVRSLQVSAALLFVISQARDGWAAFGFVRPRWSDAAAALALAVLGVLVSLAVRKLLAVAGFAASHPPSVFLRPRGHEWALAVAACLANGFAEEAVMRAFLIRRLETLGIATAGAVAFTSTVFGLYHLYQGPSAALLTMVWGGVVGTAFAVQRRLWPVALCHALVDVLAIAQLRA